MKTTRAPALTVLASALFFLSGGTALAYQVIWFKRFTHLWGSSSLAMAGVVAGFLLGLGLGARFLGGYADRVRSPLRVYGACEIGIGLFALAVPFELSALQDFTAAFYGTLQPRPLLHAVVKLAAAFVVLGPPCMLMGATLPLLVRQFVAAGGGLARATGWFYAINTAGAAAGCYAVGFHLLPLFGLATTHAWAVGVNLAVGTIAVLLGRPANEPPTPATSAAEAPLQLPWGLRLASLSTGAAALMLQMVWMRQLALLLGGTTYAFSAVVLVVLIGIGLGSLALRIFFRERDDGVRLFTLVAIGLVLTTLVGQLALPALAEYAGEVRQRRVDIGFNAALCVGTSMVLELFPSLAAGVLFPLLVHFTGARHGSAGRAVGRVYAWNTVGTTLGATLPNLILFPLVGTRATIAIALGVYLLAPVLLAGPRPLRGRLVAAGLYGVAWLALPLVLVRDTPEIRQGRYIYGEAGANAGTVVFHVEGSSCDVNVTEADGNRTLRLNGKADASTFAGDQTTQVGSGYFPRFLRPGARDLCVIGLGSGATAGASLLFPQTRRLDCLEIEKGVFDASPYFASINHEPDSFPAYRPLVDDGRGHIQATRQEYDLILTEPSNPWLAGISNLFTREFYVAVTERLRPDGLLCQWIQTYGLSFAEFEMVVRTLTDVFPHYGLLWLDEGNTLILGSMAPILPSAAALDQVQRTVDASPAILADLRAYFRFTDVRSLLLEHFLLGEEDLRAWMAGSPEAQIVTDWNMRLEFDAPLHMFAFDESHFGQRVSSKALAKAGEPFQLRAFAELGRDPDRVPAIVSRARTLAYFDRPDLARLWTRLGLELAPANVGVLANVLMYDPPVAAASFAEVSRVLIAADPEGATRVALTLAQDGQFERAEQLANGLAEGTGDPSVWLTLARVLARNEQHGPALQATERFLALAPDSVEAQELAQELRGATVPD